MKTWLVFIVLTIATQTTFATKTIPASADTVIATWPVSRSTPVQEAQLATRMRPADSHAVAQLANAYLREAALPGHSRFYGLAQAALQPLIDQGTGNADIWLAWAQVQQHQHAFKDALAALEKVKQQQPDNINAHLLAARIFLIQDNADAARQSCLTLLGNADLLTASGCALEVTSFQSDLAQSYQQLASLVEREQLPQDERGPWLAQILADMALRLKNPLAAEKWLDTQRKENASVNFLSQWADVQLALDQPKKLVQTLQPIVQGATDVDDALLLRLALAEKKMGGEQWRTELRERITLREQRMDNQHANEIARYYLDIDPQPQQALYWAQINWQNAREYGDRELLERARASAAQQQKDNN